MIVPDNCCGMAGFVACPAELGYNARDQHCSTEADIAKAVGRVFEKVHIVDMTSSPSLLGRVPEIGDFAKPRD